MPSEFDQYAPLQFAVPLRRFGAHSLECGERFVSCQFSLLHAVSGYWFKQLRGALEVRDARGLQEYLAHQAEATQDLARQLTEQASLIGCISRDLARHSLYSVVPPKVAPAGGDVGMRRVAERRRA